MPHVDELLGPATLAAAGLVVAIALQPVAGHHAASGTDARAATAPVVARGEGNTGGTANVRLPSVEVIGRRDTRIAGTTGESDGGRGGQGIARRAAGTRA